MVYPRIVVPAVTASEIEDRVKAGDGTNAVALMVMCSATWPTKLLTTVLRTALFSPALVGVNRTRMLQVAGTPISSVQRGSMLTISKSGLPESNDQNWKAIPSP